jgi:carboxymethylenebutenolidase
MRPNEDGPMTHERRIAETGVNGLLVQPDGQAPGVGVLAVPMVSGVNDQARLFATRLAEAGLTTFMWDPYPGVPEAKLVLGHPDLPRVADEAAAVDQQRCAAYLRRELGLQRLGAIGWCMGGRMVLTLAAREPSLDACVAYFPSLREPRGAHELDPIAVADTIACPVQALYGGKDHVTSPQTFARLSAALEGRGQPTVIHIYPDAEHGFLAEPRQVEPANRLATRLAWPQSLAFLQAALLDAEPEALQAVGAVSHG